MKTISFDTYITILITGLLLEFGKILFSFILNVNRLPRKKRINGILLATGIYGLIAIIATFLYKGEELFNKVAESLDSVAEFLKPVSVFVKENIANHWYNLFLPWINNNMENSFFDSILLIVFWSVTTILIVGLAILCVLYFIRLFSRLGHPFIAVGSYIALIIFAPIILFYIYNAVYLLCHCSIAITAIIMVILTGVSIIGILISTELFETKRTRHSH